jgi:hypothetical protein
MSEQGLSHSSTAEIIAKASSKKKSSMDAWGYDINRNLTRLCGLLFLICSFLPGRREGCQGFEATEEILI